MTIETSAEQYSYTPKLPTEMTQYVMDFLNEERGVYLTKNNKSGVEFIEDLISKCNSGDVNAFLTVAKQLSLHNAQLDKSGKNRNTVLEMGSRAQELEAWHAGISSTELPSLPEELEAYLLAYFRAKKVRASASGGTTAAYTTRNFSKIIEGILSRNLNTLMDIPEKLNIEVSDNREKADNNTEWEYYTKMEQYANQLDKWLDEATK